MTGLQVLAPVTIAGAFLFGLTLAFLGSLKQPLAKRLGIDEERVGGLWAALNLALIPMVFLSGILIDSPTLGVRGVMILGAVLTSLGFFSLAISRTYPRALVSFVLAGAGSACAVAGAIKLMPYAFFPTENFTAALNLGTVFIGLATLITPSLAELLLGGLGIRRGLSLLAAVCLGLAVIAIITPATAFPAQQEPGDLGEVLSDPVLWLCAFVFLLYAPLEGSLGAWAATYLTEMGHQHRTALRLFTGFWLSFLAARLVMAMAQEHGTFLRESEPWQLLILAVLAAVTLGNMTGTPHHRNAAAVLLLVGAFLGPIFPTLIGILFKHCHRDDYGTAFGTMFALGAGGSLLLSTLMGRYARRTSVRSALRIPTFLALLLTGAVLALALWVS